MAVIFVDKAACHKDYKFSDGQAHKNSADPDLTTLFAIKVYIFWTLCANVKV